MISVVVPLHNYRHFVIETIESIISQSISDWEIIIVDDASTDNPLEVIRPYLNDKIHYIRLDRNKGYGNAKNVGIQSSKGELIVVLDSDDMLTPDSLECRADYLNKHPEIAWIHARAYEFAGVKPPYNFRVKSRRATKNLKQMLKTGNFKDLWNNMHAQTVMVRRSVYKKIGLYEPKMLTMGDKEMWARIQNNIGLPAFINKFVAYYRQHNKQMHRAKWKLRRQKQFKRMLARFINARKNGNLEGVVLL